MPGEEFPERDPFPSVLAEDIGIGWAMGAVGGGIFHAIKGLRNSPRGEKLAGAWMAARIRGPVLGANFAVWGGLFTVTDQVLCNVRHVSDAYNSVAAGAMTGGILAARAGFKQAWRNALIGGLLLAVIESIGLIGFDDGVDDEQDYPKEFEQFVEPEAEEDELPLYKEPVEGLESRGNGKQLYDWEGMKSYFRLPLQDSVPIHSVGLYRRFRRHWDGFFGPYENEFMPDPIGGWMGANELEVVIDSIPENEPILRARLPDKVHEGELELAKERHRWWEELQKPKRERPRFAPQPGFVVTQPKK